MNEPAVKWQPVIVVLQGQARLECKCGALALFVTGRLVDDQYNVLDEVDVWCPACFAKAQQEE